MIARPATPGKGFDTNQTLTVVNAAKLRETYSFAVRYVPLPGVHPAGDIDSSELELLCAAGFEVMLVQHVRFPGWDPRAHSGMVDGATAAEWARNIGYPDGHIFLDLEGIKTGTDAAAVIVYANSWSGRILQSGFRAGLYVGYDVPLTPEQLYEDLSVDSYWKDPGPRVVAERGFAMVQGQEITVAGVRLDEDTLSTDSLGGRPYACLAG